MDDSISNLKPLTSFMGVKIKKNPQLFKVPAITTKVFPSAYATKGATTKPRSTSRKSSPKSQKSTGRKSALSGGTGCSPCLLKKPKKLTTVKS